MAVVARVRGVSRHIVHPIIMFNSRYSLSSILNPSRRVLPLLLLSHKFALFLRFGHLRKLVEWMKANH